MLKHWMIVSVCLLAMTVVGSASASVVYTLDESFDSPLGGVPTDWMMQDFPTPNLGAGDSAYVAPLTQGDNRLFQFRSLDGGERRSLVGYTGTLGGNLAEAGRFGNFTASVVVRPVVDNHPNHHRTIQFRAARQEYRDSGGYLAVLAESGTRLEFTIDPANHNDVGRIIGGVDMPGMDLDTDYLFTVSAIGSRLSAAVYGWDTTSGDWSATPMGSLVMNDDTYTEGYFGFRSGFLRDGGTYWSDLELSLLSDDAEPLPEPASMGLLVLGVGGLGSYLRRRRRA